MNGLQFTQSERKALENNSSILKVSNSNIRIRKNLRNGQFMSMIRKANQRK